MRASVKERNAVPLIFARVDRHLEDIWLFMSCFARVRFAAPFLFVVLQFAQPIRVYFSSLVVVQIGVVSD